VASISVREGGEVPKVPSWSGLWRMGWAPPQKKNHFYPQSDEPGCILTHISTGRKHGVTRNLGTWILWFNHKTKLTKQCKNYPKKFMVRPKKWAAIAPSPPSYATAHGCILYGCT